MKSPRVVKVLASVLFFLSAAPGAQLQAAPFIRGDADGNGVLELTDPIRILGHLFLGSPRALDCADAADGDDSGALEISDPIYLLNSLFLGGPAPPAPFPACGEDPTADALGCAAHASCAGPDREPPFFHGRGCTEIGCPAGIPMEIGEPLDLIREDYCNWCPPMRIEDDWGIARLDLELYEGEIAAGAAAFRLFIPLEPPVRLIDLTQTEVLLLDASAPGSEPPFLDRLPILQDRLRLPATLAPGAYTRRIAASDAAGNRSVHDRPAVISVPGGPFEVVQSEKARETSPDATTSEVAELVRGNTELVLDLYRAIRGTGGNLFYSSYSISMALAMTYAGARGETERQMASTLRFRLPRERLHPAFNALDLALASRGEGIDPSRGDGFKLRVTNSMWGQRGYAFLGEFLSVLAGNYGAGLRVLDFQSDPERPRLVINQWVRDETQGRIQDLLPPGSITTLTRLVLTNAIYFKASWTTPFNERATQNKPFHTLQGSTVSVPTMNADAGFGYARGEGWQAVELPYAGEKLSMVVLLPDAGSFEGFEGSLDAARLGSILRSLSGTRLLLSLPKFRFEFNLPLKATLIAMGMHDAFSETAADFSGMDGSRSLFIHDVLHKALIGVDEAGTEAAAATAVIIVPTSLPPEVTIDHPFLFLIRDIPTGAVLFLGRLVDPSA